MLEMEDLINQTCTILRDRVQKKLHSLVPLSTLYLHRMTIRPRVDSKSSLDLVCTKYLNFTVNDALSGPLFHGFVYHNNLNFSDTFNYIDLNNNS